MPNKIRAFIAIDFNLKLKQEFSRIQEELKKSNADTCPVTSRPSTAEVSCNGVKWVTPDNIHLTLKFLGYVEQEKIEKIRQIIETVSKSYSKFEIETSKLGVFPEKGTPRVVWIGIEKGSEILKKIVKDLEEKIQKLGIPKEERSFKSHLTLGRVKSSKNIVGAEHCSALHAKINELNQQIQSQAQNINEIILFQSTLTPQGSIYKELFKGELNNG